MALAFLGALPFLEVRAFQVSIWAFPGVRVFLVSIPVWAFLAA